MIVAKQGVHRLFDTDPETVRVVSEMLLDLEKNGMDAVRRYSRRFDDWDPPSFDLSGAEVETAVARVPDQVAQDTAVCQGNVRSFAKAQLATLQPLEVEIRPGVVLGHRHIPVSSVGAYIPGGRYPMFGSAQMSIIPARVAGVKHVTACTPPVKGLGYYPATINAMKSAGADRILVVGGVPAFALMAFGLDGSAPVDMLCGAGNRFVAEAKRQLYGRCGIDLLAGPTEILVLADDGADPELVACDLLGQAEHDPNAGACLICRSGGFADAVLGQIARQLETLETRDVASQAWQQNGIVYIAESDDEAVRLSDDYAPEHLELHVRNPDSTQNVFRITVLCSSAKRPPWRTVTRASGRTISCRRAGPLGTPAVCGWGNSSKTCTYQRMTAEASRDLADLTERQCRIENMAAHAETARIRKKRYGSQV